MKVGLVGEEPTVTAVADQFSDVPATVSRIEATDFDGAEMVVIAAAPDDERLHEANERARAGGVTLVTIELGGIGGLPVAGVDGAVALFDEGGPCYRCLTTRVEATDPETKDGDGGAPTFQRVAGAVAGRVAVEQLNTGGPAEIAQLIEFPYRTRSLLPVPGCETCDRGTEGRWSFPTADRSAKRELAAAVAAAERAFDERLGPVTAVGEVASLPLPYYLATLADTAGFSDATAPQQAAGVAEDWDAAFMKAVGECLERYVAGIYRNDSLRSASPGSLEDVVTPDSFVRPDGWTTREAPQRWVRAEALSSGTERWLPADTVLFPPPERRIRPAITTGLALGNTRVEAALGGLLEVLERDAAMLAWYSSYDPLAVEFDDPGVDRLRRLASVEDLSVSTTLLTQDVDVPIIAAAVHRPDRWPRFAVGSAASFDPVEAGTAAVREAIQNWMELDAMGQQEAEAEAGRIAAYATDPGPARAFFQDEASIPAARIGADEETSPERLDRLLSLTDVAGLPSYAAWLTTRDLRVLGFEAVRVVVPAAQPLFTGEPYFGDRAERIPPTMGYEPRPNRDPHPFP